MPLDPKVAIIGAGVGGLVTALQLHAHGFKNVQLFEAAAHLTSLGVGINVQPHAVLVLRDLGLLPALESIGIETQELNYYDRFGNPIISEPRGKFAGYKIPQFSIHRGRLQMLLLDAVKERLGEERVLLNHSLASFENQDHHVRLHFVQKRTGKPAINAKIEADIVIAADGINSTARRILYPQEGPPRFSGRILWRGCLEREPFLTSASMVWSGHANQKFIAYPILKYPTSSANASQKSLVNWIAELRVRDASDPDTTPPEAASWLHSVPKSHFAPAFSEWSFAFLNVPDLIAQTDQVFEFPMCDRDPVSRWTFGNLTLLGDSAHPMYPIGSNGASQAILDAACLTTQLLRWREASGRSQDISAALTAYQDERLPATAKIVMANRGNGPDHVLQVVHERAPGGFKQVDDVVSKQELESIGLIYKQIAGFDVERVNGLAEESEGTAERLGLKPPKEYSNKQI